MASSKISRLPTFAGAGLGIDVIEGRALVPAVDDELEVADEVLAALLIAEVGLFTVLAFVRSAARSSASISSKSLSCSCVLFFLCFGILHAACS
jgi:hypothetical protein